MRTIHIHFPPKGKPIVTPDTDYCLSEELLVFVITSENTYIEAVNLAFDQSDAEIFCCPGSASGVRQHHCRIDLQTVTDPEEGKVGVIWGIALRHTVAEPKPLKYTITPFVLGNLYQDGEADPYIIITKRP